MLLKYFSDDLFRAAPYKLMLVLQDVLVFHYHIHNIFNENKNNNDNDTKDTEHNDNYSYDT